MQTFKPTGRNESISVGEGKEIQNIKEEEQAEQNIKKIIFKNHPTNKSILKIEQLNANEKNNLS